MKNNQVTFILVVVFLLSTLATALLGQRYNTAYHQSQDEQARLARMRYTQLFSEQVLSATMDYSKKYPDIQQLLQIATNPAAAMPAPAPKAPTK